MHRRLLIRCAAGAFLTAIAAPLALDPGQADSDGPGKVQSSVNGVADPVTVVQRKAEAPAGPESIECDSQEDVRTPALDVESESGRNQLQKALAPLALSTNPEHLFALALAYSRDDVADSLDLLSQALVYDPDNPLILLNLGAACLRMPEAAACTAQDVEEHVLRVGENNGAVWAQVAAWRHRQGDRNGALDALRRAATAPGYDGYATDEFLLIERALAASTGYSYEERVRLAVTFPGFSGAQFNIERICANVEIDSPEWRQPCAAFGIRLEADADIAIDVALGIALQSAMHRASGNRVELARTERRQRELNELIQASIVPGEALLYGDEVVLSEYVTEFTGHGELAAMRYLKQTLASRASSIDVNSCRN